MLVKGPFTLKWGNNPLLDVSEISFSYDVASNDYNTVDGRRYRVDGAITASVELTLLSSDVPALRVLLPQYYVAKGSTLSTGQEVLDDDGAIDIVAASCDTGDTNYNLDIISCNGQVTRLVNARTSLTSQEFADNSLRTVHITFTGEPEVGQAIVQFFKENGISEES